MSVQETAGKQIEEAVAATVARIATETADQVRGKPEAAETLQKDSAEATEEGAQKTAEDVNEGQGVAAGVESECDEPAAEPVMADAAASVAGEAVSGHVPSQEARQDEDFAAVKVQDRQAEAKVQPQAHSSARDDLPPSPPPEVAETADSAEVTPVSASEERVDDTGLPAQDDVNSVLLTAAEEGDVEMLVWALGKGADASSAGVLQRTALHFAVPPSVFLWISASRSRHARVCATMCMPVYASTSSITCISESHLFDMLYLCMRMRRR